MKRYRLKEEVKRTLLLILIIIVVFYLCFILKKMDDEFMESCTKAGNSIEYCQENK